MNAPERPSSRAKAAVLTGSGRGAIAVVRIWGPDALTVVDALFRPARGQSLLATPANRPRFGRFGLGQGDEVVALVLDTERSEVEIQGHGGVAASRLILDSLRDRGVEIVLTTEVGDGDPPSWAREAERDLPHAPTLRTAQILLDQSEGILDRDISRLIEELDRDPQAASGHIDTLIARSLVGTRLIDGWRVVLTGRPNVGKSRLMNAMSGFDRAVVSAISGTTRDLVTVRTAIDGWPVELTDTAGLRPSDDLIESAGIALARDRIASADCVLVILDRSSPLSDEDREVLASYPLALRVANKSDLPAAWDATSCEAISVSAAMGEGLAILMDEISRRLVPEPPPEGSAVPFREDLVATLRQIRESVEHGERVEAIARLRGLPGRRFYPGS